MRVTPLIKGVFVTEHREVIEEYDMARLGNTNALMLEAFLYWVDYYSIGFQTVKCTPAECFEPVAGGCFLRIFFDELTLH